jgi:arylsulfatase A-like enzyme
MRTYAMIWIKKTRTMTQNHGTSFPLLLFFLSMLIFSCGKPAGQEPKVHELPNILFIAVDDLKPAIGSYDDPMAITPNLDRIGNAGTTFMLNYCQQAVCAPSRASLLTGRYPDQLQVWDLQTLIREKSPGIITLPQYFRMSGYTTAATGKIFDPRSLEGSWGGPHDSLSWSWEYISSGELDTYHEGLGRPEYFYAGTEARERIGILHEEARAKGINSPGDIREYVQREYFPAVECADLPFDAYVDGAIAKHGIRLMDSLSGNGRPFFLAVGFNRPHLPFTAPKKYWDLYDRNDFSLADFRHPAKESPPVAYHNSGELRNGYTGIPKEGPLPDSLQLELIHGYYAAITFIDDMIGMLMTRLDELGLTDNTILVVWGDHGWHLGDHGMWCKHSNFEQATRSPLIMSYPRQLTKGGKHYGPTEFTDVAPTLCDLAGIPVPEYFEGRSLKSLLDDPEQEFRLSALSQYPRQGLEIMGYSIRTERYRYTQWIDRTTHKILSHELYDYEVDPLETVSLANRPEYADQLHLLDSMLTRRIQEPSTKLRN